jgi:4-amino-4-deoxy-L-arabinose transferase-like glycosyltransferase
MLGEFTRTPLRIGPALLGLALTVGLVLRLAPILLAAFPLQDGGLFVTMARDIRHAGFGLPDFSTYNAGDVPFAYPPLGLYVLALIPGDPISTERWLPLVWSMLAIPAAFLLARELTDERRGGLAALIFAAMPATWAIEGAGVTRALALALLLFALWRVAVVLRIPTMRNAAMAGILAGAAVLTHPAIGPTGVASAALLFAFSPSMRRFVALVGAGLVGAVVVVPWLVMVIVRYGAAVVLAAGSAHHTDETLGRLLILGPSWIGALDFVLAFALLGLVIVVRRRDWLLPAWLLLLIIVPGGGGRYAAIVWAMLAATGVVLIAESMASAGALRLAAGIGIAWLFVAALLAGYQRFEALPEAARRAIVEAGSQVPPGARFAVQTDDPGLEQSLLDWFPTLSGRVSLGSFLGLEWTSPERWNAAVALHHRIQSGDIPAEADYVFTFAEGSASWGPAR